MGISDLKAKHIISQLFPDAPFVGEGNLVQKDIENENRYLNYLFLCVRGGDLQRAQRICLQRGDITRAVAMEAWRPFHSSYLSEDIANSDNHVVEGNASRVLSKSVAWWSAENPALNIHERAIFAAQSGNLSALLAAVTSGSWEDLLWAHCRALVESRVDATLRSKLYCGPRADTLAVFGRPQNGRTIENVGLQVPDSAWTPGTWSLSDAFTKAETVMGWRPVDYLFKLMEDESTFDPPPLKPTEIAAFLNRTAYDAVKASGDPRLSSRQMLLQAMFYTIYRGIALQEYSEVLTAVASVTPLFIPPLIREILSAGVSNAKWPDQLTLDQLDCHVLRFLAHLVLCLQKLESSLPEEPCNAILEAYIITLIVERRLPLVASYVSRLSTSVRQTRWYASFLSSLKKLEDRHQCLDYAEEAGLDVKRITRAVIRIVRRRFDEQENTGVEDKARAGPFLKPSQTRVVDIVSSDMVPYLTQLDKVRIAALDWLAHDRGQRGELLVLANSLMRLFIAMKKLGAARAVLERLPMALVDQLKVKLLQAEEAYDTEVAKAAVPPWLANSIREHVCLVNYLQAMESFDQWYIHRSSKPNPPVETNNNAASAFTSLAERVAAEEVQKNYQDRLECWNHEVELYTTALVKQLESLLSYESPGWLVDAVVFKINTTDSDVTYDATGMFNTSTMHTIGGNEYEPSVEGEEHGEEDFEGDGGPGIAGLGDSPHARKLQMNILRETCLREIVFTLVKVLKLTNRHAECVRLSDLVADSRYEIFKLFRDYHMQDFMEQLQESMLILQKECGDALGYGEN
ncbi:unnamed protein product [Hymenolepis diminuta]|uniref:Nuclear pore complex protein n=1 Tax=Hymenolepis diminuta TaxID=6216 RepID=A0A564Z597_HYMDI|nr:unnamed protein product [Hymenolepis diminuta]